jgi:lysozyme
MKSGIIFTLLLIGFYLYLDRLGGSKNSALAVVDVNARLALSTLNGAPNVNMKLSTKGLSAIAQRETFSAYIYQDAGHQAIGFGHDILVGESFSPPITIAQGYALLSSDASIAERAVQGYVQVPLNQDQFDALVSFVFNVGVNAFRSSTLLKLLNQSDYAGAADQMSVWDKAHINGQLVVSQALVDRRSSEQQQFLA